MVLRKKGIVMTYGVKTFFKKNSKNHNLSV